MVAANSLRGDHPLAAWDELEAKVLPEVAAGKALLVDVREVRVGDEPRRRGIRQE